MSSREEQQGRPLEARPEFCMVPLASQPTARPLQGMALASLPAPPFLTWKLGAAQTLAAAALSWPLCRGAMLPMLPDGLFMDLNA